MSAMEILVSVIFLAIGYWIVSALMTGKSGADRNAGQSSQGWAERDRSVAPQPSSIGWHEVLGVAPSATADEIRGAYKKLMSQYHPDKVAALGQELRDLAETKSKDITGAYREGMRVHGMDV